MGLKAMTNMQVLRVTFTQCNLALISNFLIIKLLQQEHKHTIYYSLDFVLQYVLVNGTLQNV